MITIDFAAIEAELRRVRDVDAQKLNVVRRQDRHTYDAIMWLRAHRNEFTGVIYEPPLMTVRTPLYIVITMTAIVMIIAIDVNVMLFVTVTRW